jgi:hypothetical protein
MTLPPRVSDLIPFDLLLSVARLGSLGYPALLRAGPAGPGSADTGPAGRRLAGPAQDLYQIAAPA